MYNFLTIGAGTGGSASRLLAWGLGWEDSATLANILTGITRVVHGPTLAWKVVPAAFVPRAVHYAVIPKVVNAPFIPRVERSEAISKAVLSRATGRVVQESRISRAHAPDSFTGKAVVSSTIPKVQHYPRVGKVVK